MKKIYHQENLPSWAAKKLYRNSLSKAAHASENQCPALKLLVAKVARQAEQMVHIYVEENEVSVQEEPQTNCLMRRCCNLYNHFVKLSCNNGFAQIHAKSFAESGSTTDAHRHVE